MPRGNTTLEQVISKYSLSAKFTEGIETYFPDVKLNGEGHIAPGKTLTHITDTYTPRSLKNKRFVVGFLFEGVFNDWRRSNISKKATKDKISGAHLMAYWLSNIKTLTDEKEEYVDGLYLTEKAIFYSNDKDFDTKHKVSDVLAEQIRNLELLLGTKHQNGKAPKAPEAVPAAKPYEPPKEVKTVVAVEEPKTPPLEEVVEETPAQPIQKAEPVREETATPAYTAPNIQPPVEQAPKERKVRKPRINYTPRSEKVLTREQLNSPGKGETRPPMAYSPPSPITDYAAEQTKLNKIREKHAREVGEDMVRHPRTKDPVPKPTGRGMPIYGNPGDYTTVDSSKVVATTYVTVQKAKQRVDKDAGEKLLGNSQRGGIPTISDQSKVD